MDKELLEAGYRAYTGEKIDVYFNTAICQHSGNCVRGSAKLFNLKRKPWIIPSIIWSSVNRSSARPSAS
ncbi:TPA: (4Fe-4S)-binding protein [Klebsiella pneumoniae]|nr:(4Fe-4S)-binding protein [Klebsiella pneumoniae]